CSFGSARKACKMAENDILDERINSIASRICETLVLFVLVTINFGALTRNLVAYILIVTDGDLLKASIATMPLLILACLELPKIYAFICIAWSAAFIYLDCPGCECSDQLHEVFEYIVLPCILFGSASTDKVIERCMNCKCRGIRFKRDNRSKDREKLLSIFNLFNKNISEVAIFKSGSIESLYDCGWNISPMSAKFNAFAGRIRVLDTGESLTVQWNSMSLHKGESGLVSFQARIYKEGKIEFVYRTKIPTHLFAGDDTFHGYPVFIGAGFRMSGSCEFIGYDHDLKRDYITENTVLILSPPKQRSLTTQNILDLQCGFLNDTIDLNIIELN
ncbi:Hypothetical predicted protein, partial [Cloeon dipterum]